MCCVPTKRRVVHHSVSSGGGKYNYAHLLKPSPATAIAAGHQHQRHQKHQAATTAVAPNSSIHNGPVVTSSSSTSPSPTSTIASSPRGTSYLQRGPPAEVRSNVPLSSKPSSLTPIPVLAEQAQQLVLSAALTAKGSKRRRIRKKLPPGLTAKQHTRQYVQHDYHDHAQDDPQEYFDSVNADTTGNHHQPKLCGGTGNSGGVTIPFPFRLHTLLEQIQEDGFGSVISWQPHGRAFVIHDKDTFVSKIMPQYFKQTKLTSFQRQLNLYGFTRLSRGTDARGYYHELFLRNMPFLCHRMIRTKCKGTGFKAASDPDTEPNFYNLLPFVTHPKDYWKTKPVRAVEQDQVTYHPSEVLPIAGQMYNQRQVSCHEDKEELFFTDLNQSKQEDTRSPVTFESRQTSVPLMCFDFQDSVNARGKYMPTVPGTVAPVAQPYLDPCPSTETPFAAVDFIPSTPSWSSNFNAEPVPTGDYSPALMFDTAQMQSMLLGANNSASNMEPTPLVSPVCTREWDASPGSANSLVMPHQSSSFMPDMPFAVNAEWTMDGTDSDTDYYDDTSVMQTIMQDASTRFSDLNDTPLLDNDEALGHLLEFLVES